MHGQKNIKSNVYCMACELTIVYVRIRIAASVCLRQSTSVDVVLSVQLTTLA